MSESAMQNPLVRRLIPVAAAAGLSLSFGACGLVRRPNPTACRS